jgi:hypothetical protein
MTLENDPRELFARFKLPPTDLARLRFCESSRPAAVRNWAQSLPATRVSYTSVLLYKALPEISRLRTSADHRLEMLEALRPSVQQCIQGLAKHFLNQPLVLPEAPLKSAVIAQALQKHMAVGYLAVLESLTSQRKKGTQPDPRLGLSLHRAITGYGLMLLRSYQLYSPTPGNLWLDLHSLYRIAEDHQLLDQVVADPFQVHSSSSTVSHAYIRILLLACARPNQMRQTDVSATYNLLESWSHLARIRDARAPDSGSLFLINLSADLAPMYKSRFAGGSQDALRELDLAPLLAGLRRDPRLDHSSPHTSHAVPPSLLEHLQQAWGATQQRSFQRRPGKSSIQLCVGLSSLHHHTAGRQSLADFLGTSELEDIDLGPAGDSWVSAPGQGASSRRREDFRIYSVPVGDSSPGGYRLDWRDNLSPQIKAGEVLGLREVGRHRWSLGVIRWLQQDTETTRLGVQLLAPSVTAYGAAVEQSGGDYSDFRRVLMLPELKAANQPATLITAFAPFQEGQRVRLNRHGDVFTATLQRRIFSTGSVSQFTFRRLASEDDAPEKNADSGADWS